jgi:uncharacterized protein (TIGR02270 family)
LGRTDERLQAHLDGLAVAGAEARPLLDADDASPGAVFAAGIHAVARQDQNELERLFGRDGSSRQREELTAALAWCEAGALHGLTTTLVSSQEGAWRIAAIAVCAMRGEDPGAAVKRWLADSSPIVRARALRAAGEIGQSEVLSVCTAASDDEDPECAFWAAWSAVLLGERGRALESVTTAGTTDHPHRARAFRLVLQARQPAEGHVVLQRLARDPQQLRWVVQGSGIVGDPTYVSWLIGHMRKPETARLAGEAFTLITGADLSALQLETTQPDDFESGPNDDPDDPNVAMDPDEGLPWPDVPKVEQWWAAHAGRFQKGQRCFLGPPVTRAHCIDVLKNGHQRQRILAAHYLCLLEPGTPLFNTSAPAWRQQRLLAQME